MAIGNSFKGYKAGSDFFINNPEKSNENKKMVEIFIPKAMWV